MRAGVGGAGTVEREEAFVSGSPSILSLPPRTFDEVVTTTGSASLTASSKRIDTCTITSQNNQLINTQNHFSVFF